MKVSFASCSMPMNKRIQFCGERIPLLNTNDTNRARIVADESSKSGLDLLPTDKVASARGGIVWDLTFIDPKTPMPQDIASELIRLGGGDLIAFDKSSSVIHDASKVLPDTKIAGWGAYSLDTLGLLVKAFKGLLDGMSTQEILQALKRT